MIAMSGKSVEIVFTGLRRGEKLHEELVGSRENLERPFQPEGVAHAGRHHHARAARQGGLDGPDVREPEDQRHGGDRADPCGKRCRGVSERIYMSSPDVGEAEEQAVVAAMRSGWIAPLGPDVDAFERELAERVGVAHAVALSSGTAALHLALLTVGREAGRRGAHLVDDLRCDGQRHRLHRCRAVLHRRRSRDREHGCGAAA